MLPARRYNNQWIPDVFNDFFDNDWMVHTRATAPAINVIENEQGYELELAAPGMTKEDFKVTLDADGDLVINMEKKHSDEEKKHGHYLRREYSYTKFQQTMLLPDDTDREAIGAKVENGVLLVNMPKLKKVEAEKAKKQITIE